MEAPRLLEPKDFYELQVWSAQHGLGLVSPGAFPTTTFIIPGYAAWSLYLTGTTVAYMDNMIANPAVAHGQALDILANHVFQYAITQGVQQLITYTLYDKVVTRAKKLGFALRP